MCNVSRNGKAGGEIVVISLEGDDTVYCAIPIHGACVYFLDVFD